MAGLLTKTKGFEVRILVLRYIKKIIFSVGFVFLINSTAYSSISQLPGNTFVSKNGLDFVLANASVATLISEPRNTGFGELNHYQNKSNQNKRINISSWRQIANSSTLKTSNNPLVQQRRNWFVKNPAYLKDAFHNATPYLDYVVDELKDRNMPLELALLPIIESRYLNSATSQHHAAGIWQIIPSTADMLKINRNEWIDGRRDIFESTRGALDYLEAQYKSFGDWHLALAAYNAGPGTVRRAIRANREAGKSTDFWSLRLPKETRYYVPKLIAVSQIVKNPSQYGFKLPKLKRSNRIIKIDVGQRFDLKTISVILDIDLKDLKKANANLLRTRTAPNGPHNLLIPVRFKNNFEVHLAKFDAAHQLFTPERYHSVRKGETLSDIAQQYSMRTSQLIEMNGIRGTLIKPGQKLMVNFSNTSSSQSGRQLAVFQENKSSNPSVSHKVNKGDTLWEIAKHYEVSISQLVRWNQSVNNSRESLQVGQKLIVYTNR